jgi:phosphatidylglycerol:prolipoprotein diacylglycerol transferase
MYAIAFPAIDPVAFAFGPFTIRWYALAYLAGFILGWQYCLRLARSNERPPLARDVDDFLVWAVAGVILGGRVGYVLFYNADLYWHHPLQAIEIWTGGMSFHGGLIGVVTAIVLFSLRRGFSPLRLGDLIVCAVPIGLFFGRIANFVNDELYGRVTDVPWAVLFPRGGFLPRHPSQLYEAFLEGLVLFTLLAVLARRPGVRARSGLLGGIFCIGYALCRILVELFREPDAQLGFLVGGATMGQLLSLPLLLAGVVLVVNAKRQRPEG